MKLTHNQYKKFDRLNKRLASWQKKGTKSAIVQEVEAALLNFYDEEDIDISRMKYTRFKRSNDMTKDQIKKLERIANMMEAQPESKVSFFETDQNILSYNKAFQTSKKRYGVQVTDFDSYVKFYERMNNLSSRLKEYYSSKQIVTIFEYGFSKGLKYHEITKIMFNQSRATKTPDDQRYDKTIDKIKTYYNKHKK